MLRKALGRRLQFGIHDDGVPRGTSAVVVDLIDDLVAGEGGERRAAGAPASFGAFLLFSRGLGNRGARLSRLGSGLIAKCESHRGQGATQKQPQNTLKSHQSIHP